MADTTKVATEHAKTLRDFIHRPLIVVDELVSLRKCAMRLTEQQVGVLVVCHSRAPVGVIGERDLTRAVSDGIDLEATSAADYMTDGVLTIDEEASAEDALRAMDKAGVRHLVVTSHKAIIGMLSMRDAGLAVRTRVVRIAGHQPVRKAFDVPEADALEQGRDWVEDGPRAWPTLRADVPEADLIDQSRPVPMREEEDEHPR